MQPADILTRRRVGLSSKAASKKRLLEEAAELLAGGLEELTGEQVYERLLERERLGSTGLSGGVALPHARIAGIDEARGAFLRLAEPVDFDAMDGQPVDLVFALLVPEEATDEHLQLLASLARAFSDEAVRERLRQAEEDQILSIIAGEEETDAAGGRGPGSVRLPA
jgi:PTS system nitrogen regulatory IIA component